MAQRRRHLLYTELSPQVRVLLLVPFRNQSDLLSSSIFIDTIMKYVNIDISDIDFNLPISYYSKKYGLSVNAVRVRFKNLGIYDRFIFTKNHTSTIRFKLLKTEYENNPKRCLNCSSIISYKKRKNQYCSTRCSSTYTQKSGGNHKWNSKEKEKLSELMKTRSYRKPKSGVEKLCLNCKNKFYVCQSQFKKKCCSKPCSIKWIRDTEYMKGKTGGYRKEAGRGKMGWYKGYYCNSSWELAWVIFHLEHGLSFERNTDGFSYIFENKTLKFYPDFKLKNSNEFFEIKGWITNKDKEKIKQFRHPLKVFYKKDLGPIFEYVTKKYGKHFTDLYED